MNRNLLAIPLGLALVLAGCGGERSAKSPAPEVARDLALTQVVRATVPDYVEAVGTVKAAQASDLSAQIVGTVLAVNVHEGLRVRRGDVLVVLEDAQQRAALSRATAAVSAAQQDIAAATAESDLANSTLARYESLYSRRSVSPHEMDEVQARAKAAAAHRDQADAGMSQARAMEEQARTGLSYTRIRAPFDGVITAKRVDPGALASPGTPLLTIEDTRRFRVEAAVDEGDLRAVKLREAAPVWLDALGGALAGKVAEIVPAADPASRSFIVKVDLAPDTRLHTGFFARVRFPKGTREAVMLPKSAVISRGQLQNVYVVGNDKLASLRYVTLGPPDGEQVEVLSGLEAGERVVVAPGERELAGKRIEVSQ